MLLGAPASPGRPGAGGASLPFPPGAECPGAWILALAWRPLPELGCLTLARTSSPALPRGVRDLQTQVRAGVCQSNGEERLARPQLPSPVTQVPACSEKAKCVLLGKKPLGARSLPRTSKSGSQVEAPTASLSSPHPSCKRMADARVPGIALFPGTAVGGGGSVHSNCKSWAQKAGGRCLQPRPRQTGCAGALWRGNLKPDRCCGHRWQKGK